MRTPWTASKFHSDFGSFCRCSLDRFTLHLDDQVTTKGDRTGYVRYIGHIDKPNAAHVVYAGLELEKPGGYYDEKNKTALLRLM